jgi:hypothetical protein
MSKDGLNGLGDKLKHQFEIGAVRRFSLPTRFDTSGLNCQAQVGDV